MSKKIFSVQDWENVPSEVPVLPSCQPSPTDTAAVAEQKDAQRADISRIVSEVEARGIDIAPDYKDWVSLGFALVDVCSEEGRGYYHRLSRLHGDYNEADTDRQYDNCLHGKGQGITCATFFYLAEQAGVPVRNPQIPISPFTQQGENCKKWVNVGENERIYALSPAFTHDGEMGKLGKWVKQEEELPQFPDSVYDRLPPFLNEVVANAMSEEDRDTILIGSLTTLSVCLGNVQGVYDQRKVHPNLYLFVTAEAGMGKGALSLCRELVAPINRQLNEISRQAVLEYKRDMADYVQARHKEGMLMPEEPPRKMLIIPANSSAASLMRILKDNGGVGLLFETEGDTLSQTLKSDYGNYSDILRKGYHHETMSMSRSKDKEYYEIENPRISVVLAGTPEQVRRLIPSAEDGLFSRFVFYFIRFRRSFRDVLSTTGLSESKNVKFQMLGEKFFHLLEAFVSRGEYSFHIPSELARTFVDTLAEMNDECCDEVDNNMQGVVRRIGLMAYRIMMVLTSVRMLTGGLSNLPRSPDGTIPLVCCKDDFETAMSICRTLLTHAVFVYRRLAGLTPRQGPPSDNAAAARRNALFCQLPQSFTKKDFAAITGQLGESLRTAEKWIDTFIREGRLRRTGQGEYMKLTT